MKIFKINTSYSKIVLLLATLFLCSCENKTKRMNEHISYLQNETKFKELLKLDWRLKHFFEKDAIEYYIVDYQATDTFACLEFKYYKDKREYEFKEYYKSYMNQKKKCFFSLKWCYDTLYFNIDLDTIGLRKKFIVGKYYYLYENNQLTPNQKKYFELNKDSLMKVRGDDLPRLPEFK